jgi:hypothetical protein
MLLIHLAYYYMSSDQIFDPTLDPVIARARALACSPGAESQCDKTKVRHATILFGIGTLSLVRPERPLGHAPTSLQPLVDKELP